MLTSVISAMTQVKKGTVLTVLGNVRKTAVKKSPGKGAYK